MNTTQYPKTADRDPSRQTILHDSSRLQVGYHAAEGVGGRRFFVAWARRGHHGRVLSVSEKDSKQESESWCRAEIRRLR